MQQNSNARIAFGCTLVQASQPAQLARGDMNRKVDQKKLPGRNGRTPRNRRQPTTLPTAPTGSISHRSAPRASAPHSACARRSTPARSRQALEGNTNYHASPAGRVALACSLVDLAGCRMCRALHQVALEAAAAPRRAAASERQRHTEEPGRAEPGGSGFFQGAPRHHSLTVARTGEDGGSSSFSSSDTKSAASCSE